MGGGEPVKTLAGKPTAESDEQQRQQHRRPFHKTQVQPEQADKILEQPLAVLQGRREVFLRHNA